MTPDLRRTTHAAVLVVLALLLGASFAPSLAFAQEPPPEPVVVTLTAEGATPEFIEVPVGGTVVFVNDDTVPHQITDGFEDGKSTAWEYDSGVLPPRDGETRAESPPTPPFEAAGRYLFTDAYGLLLTSSRTDEIGVLAPAPPPAEPAAGDDSSGSGGQPGPGPSGEPSPGPSGEPGASPAPAGGEQPGGAAPGAGPGAPAPTGGTGTTAPLPLGGGFGSFASTPAPIPGLDPLAPAIAPPLELAAEPLATPPDVAPEVAAPPQPAPGIAALPTGSLPGSGTDRAYGLPAALAAVAIVGVVSLLVRALLAEPAARRTSAGLPSRPVTITA